MAKKGSNSGDDGKKRRDSKQQKKKEDAVSEITQGVISREITEEMREAYLDYAMSVITARALPDIRDGLKPVHRRILYTMHQMGLTSGARFRKSAAIIGEVMGKYHPHGDSAIYDALAKMAQDFNYRYPLIIGQGNFGSIDGDAPAAMRYTEAKMSPIAGELLRDLEKDTVEWRPNYDGTKNEPTVLPAVVPNLLLNGQLGIAVGMATSIPPHNLTEVCDATMHLIDSPKATTDDLLNYIQGPDFPTGGIAFNTEDIHHAYANGTGGVVCRGDAEIIEAKAGSYQIIISSLPYRVNKADLIVKIANLVRDKKIEGIKDLRDESTGDIRIVIDLKSGAQPQRVLNYLYKHTQLEDTFHYNMVGLVDGVPQTLPLKTVLSEFVSHRQTVVRRRTEHDLAKARDREHILTGLKKALDHIDEIIQTIKKSKDTQTAHANLMKSFKLSDRQATAILEMRLQKLAGLERQKIEDELKEVQKLISELESILGSEKKMLKLIKDELADIKKRYGDDRRTTIVSHAVKNINPEDLVPEEENVLVLTAGGYVKRTNPSEYKRQKRGGVGVIDLNTKEEDFVTRFLTAQTHSDMLFFSDRGKAYQVKMYELPEGKRSTKGKALVNYLSLSGEEHVTSVLEQPRDLSGTQYNLFVVTKHGMVKKMAPKSFNDVRRNGIIAMNLADDDELIRALFVAPGEDVVLVSGNGQSVRFAESDVRATGRTAGGVRGIKLGKDDYVVSADVVPEDDSDSQLLVMSTKGYGKRTALSEYKQQKRGGGGIKTAKATEKTGQIIAARIVTGEAGELVVISGKGQVIRIDAAEVPVLSRATQGVRVMKLRTGDAIASLILLREPGNSEGSKEGK